MPLTALKTWIPGEVLDFSDLNAMNVNLINFVNDNVVNNPAVANFDLNGYRLIIDADADLNLVETSDDVVALRINTTSLFVWDSATASAVNGVKMLATIASDSVEIQAQGTDSQIHMRMVPKGAQATVSSSGGWAVEGTTEAEWRVSGSGGDFVIQENTGSVASPTWTTRITLPAAAVDWPRNTIAVGTADRLVYNAASTGEISDLAAITASRLLRSDAAGLPIAIDAITAARALISDSNGYPTQSAVTSVELGYSSGVTSAIQTQLNALASTFKFLAAYTPSATASVDITSQISSTYPYYLIAWDSLIPATDDSELRMLTSADNGATWDTAAGSYEFLAIMFRVGGVAVSSNESGSATYGLLAGETVAAGAVDNAVSGASGFMIWFRAASLGIWLSKWENSVNNAAIGFGFTGRLSGTPNAIQIAFESGNITSGNVRIYGIKDA